MITIRIICVFNQCSICDLLNFINSVLGCEGFLSLLNSPVHFTILMQLDKMDQFTYFQNIHLLTVVVIAFNL
jgi:hypothetical protein